MMIPPGSLPGIKNFATAPINNPTKAAHIHPIDISCAEVSGLAWMQAGRGGWDVPPIPKRRIAE